MDKLADIFKKNWKTISFSYFLFSLSSILEFTYPKVFGDTVDHLINSDYTQIWKLGLVFIGMIAFDYVSRIYDIKIFSSIYRKFTSREINNQIDKGIDTSKINGRLSLMYSIIDFFKIDVAIIIQTIFGIIVSLYFISLESTQLVFWLLLSGVIIIALSYYFTPKIAKITKERNNLEEEQTQIVTTRKIRFINNLLRKRQKLSILDVKISTQYNVFIQIVVYLTVTVLLTYYVMNNEVTIGSVFSTYRYMFDFCSSVIGLTYTITSVINMICKTYKNL